MANNSRPPSDPCEELVALGARQRQAAEARAAERARLQRLKDATRPVVYPDGCHSEETNLPSLWTPAAQAKRLLGAAKALRQEGIAAVPPALLDAQSVTLPHQVAFQLWTLAFQGDRAGLKDRFASLRKERAVYADLQDAMTEVIDWLIGADSPWTVERLRTWLAQTRGRFDDNPPPDSWTAGVLVGKSYVYAVELGIVPQMPVKISYSVEGARGELDDLILLAARAGGGDAPTIHTPEVYEWGKRSLKGIEWRTVELLCLNGGIYPLADLAADPLVAWDRDDIDSRFNSTRKRINPKLQRAGLLWRVHRNDNRAVLSKPNLGTN